MVNTVYLGLANFLAKFFSFFSSLLVLRLLTVDEAGVLTYGISFITLFFPLLCLEFGSISFYYVPRLKNKLQKSFSILFIALIIGVFVSIVLLLLRNNIISLLNLVGYSGLSDYFLVLIFTGLMLFLYSLVLLVLQSINNFKTFFYCNIGQSLFLLVLVVLDYCLAKFFSINLLISRYRVTGLLIYYLISYIPFVIIGFSSVLKKFPFKLNFNFLKSFGKLTLQFYPVFFISFGIPFVINNILFFASKTELSFLNLFQLYFLVLSFSVGSLISAAIPLIISKKRDFSFYTKLFTLYSLTFLFLAPLFAFVFPYATTILFSGKYANSLSFFPEFFLGMILWIFISVFILIFTSFKYNVWNIYFYIDLSLLVQLIVFLVLGGNLLAYSLSLIAASICLFLISFVKIREFRACALENKRLLALFGLVVLCSYILVKYIHSFFLSLLLVLMLFGFSLLFINVFNLIDFRVLSDLFSTFKNKSIHYFRLIGFRK